MKAITPHRKLLSIVCEACLESRVAHDLGALGASGYTVIDARGQGAHGTRDGIWPPSANVRFEVICDMATAEVISTYLHDNYYQHYGMISYLSDVQVLRPEKFF
ncbi:MAG: transcriptional regulator [Rhodocyclaceae bacterium]